MEVSFYKRAIQKRIKEHCFRKIPYPTRHRIDLASNDYLRLSESSNLINSAKNAVEKYGASSCASPLIGGYSLAHRFLENSLLEWYSFSDCLIWNSGYAANRAILSKLPQENDLILADKWIHNSMLTGMLESPAKYKRYPHLDLEQLTKLLETATGKYQNIFVVTESVFSMDGDYPDIKKIAALKKRFSFIWVLDEAHAIGWYGKNGSGLAEQYQVLPHVDIFVGTFGKALASQGAFTGFQQSIFKEYLIQFSDEFIYSTYLNPISAEVAKTAICETKKIAKKLPFQLTEMSKDFRRKLRKLGLLCPTGDSPIVPIPVESPEEGLSIANKLKRKGIHISAIRPPTVPLRGSRLRLSLYRGFSLLEQEKVLEALTD